MTKSLYLAIAVGVLAPSLVAGVGVLRVARLSRSIALREQHVTSERVYVITSPITVEIGRLRITVYPRVWAAVCIFAGAFAWLVGAVVIFFVRQ